MRPIRRSVLVVSSIHRPKIRIHRRAVEWLMGVGGGGERSRRVLVESSIHRSCYAIGFSRWRRTRDRSTAGLRDITFCKFSLSLSLSRRLRLSERLQIASGAQQSSSFDDNEEGDEETNTQAIARLAIQIEPTADRGQVAGSSCPFCCASRGEHMAERPLLCEWPIIGPRTSGIIGLGDNQFSQLSRFERAAEIESTATLRSEFCSELLSLCCIVFGSSMRNGRE